MLTAKSSIAATSVRRAQSLVLAGVGLVCVALGVIGIFVPGLPTTVFLLLAAYLFARSSPRLHARLVENRHLGAYIRMAHERRMPTRAKVVTLAAMWIGVAASLIRILHTAPVIAPVLVIAAGVGTVMICRLSATARVDCVEPISSRG